MRRRIFPFFRVVGGIVIALLILRFVLYVGPKLVGHQNGGIDITRIAIVGLEDGVELYARDHDGNFPQGTEKELFKLLIEPPDMAPPILAEPVSDEWGNLLKYEFPTDKRADGKPAIWSVGEDGVSGTADDITNW